jgi:hypothetical protein
MTMTRPQRSFWFTVCGPGHAWLKTFTGHTHHSTYVGSVRKAKDDARAMCRARRASGLGVHYIEVREIPKRDDPAPRPLAYLGSTLAGQPLRWSKREHGGAVLRAMIEMQAARPYSEFSESS